MSIIRSHRLAAVGLVIAALGALQVGWYAIFGAWGGNADGVFHANSWISLSDGPPTVAIAESFVLVGVAVAAGAFSRRGARTDSAMSNGWARRNGALVVGLAVIAICVATPPLVRLEARLQLAQAQRPDPHVKYTANIHYIGNLYYVEPSSYVPLPGILLVLAAAIGVGLIAWWAGAKARATK
jgi:hypothetical protein